MKTELLQLLRNFKQKFFKKTEDTVSFIVPNIRKHFTVPNF